MFTRIWLTGLIILAQVIMNGANVEFDNLAMEFQNGFNLVSKKMGLTEDSAGPPRDIEEAEKQMREMYIALERNLMDARQRAANSRSSVTSAAIEQLKLV